MGANYNTILAPNMFARLVGGMNFEFLKKVVTKHKYS